MTSSKRIHPLPLQLANQIAAGEVIERPASVIKELVENSIDAGATQIDIDIEGAGIQLMRVYDNGAGIHPEDLTLALSRHATSKLVSSEQLSQINSLGFRGEALPSIGSVSQLTLTSRQADCSCAWQIIAGETQTTPAAHPPGTTVEIRDLFFNLPARRRFLRSDKTELHHILTTVRRLALSRFDVGFNCQLSSQTRLKLAAIDDAAKQHQRIARICGQLFIDQSVYIQQSYDAIQLCGWVGTPAAHRAQTDVQYFFINGRVIRDKVINHALRQAYGDTIPIGRQPAYVLYLTLPLDRIDVNVHPTKHEVRFRDARLIHGLITSAVQEGLNQDQPALSPLSLTEPLPQPATLNIAEQLGSYQAPPLTARPPRQTGAQSSPLAIAPRPESDSSSFKLIALLHQRYALVLLDQQYGLVDLMVADKMSRQQQLQQALENNTLKSRPILVPIRIQLPTEQIDVMHSHHELLSRLGFDFVKSGQEIQIKAIPSLLAQSDITSLITTLAANLSQQKADIATITQILQKLVPTPSQFSHQQASILLPQLEQSLSCQPQWYQKLDQQSLSSLFST